MALLEIRSVSKAFPIEAGVFRTRIGHVQALRDVSMAIQPSETVALVGGSGCGKTTLGKIVAGLLVADSGSLLWKGQPLSDMNRRKRSRCIQMIFQDPFASLNPKLSVGTQLHEAVRQMTKAGSEIKSRSIQLLESVGLPGSALSHYPFQFSGGQRQRIAIARALALKPELLIADEPLSALDVSIQAQILDLFKKLRLELKLSMLFITHDLAVAGQAADRVIVLQDGRLVEEGTPATTLRHPHHPYTQALLAAVPHLPC